MGGTAVCICAAFGEMLLALTGLFIHNFRTLLLTLHIPGLFVIAYFWLVPESVRWLLAIGKVERAEKILRKVAKTNHMELSPRSVEIIYEKGHESTNEVTETSTGIPIRVIFTSGFFLTRFAITSFTWIVCAYVFYGVTLMSTQLGGNTDKFTCFMWVTASQVPADLMSAVLMNKIGRRKTLMGAFILSGISLLASPLVPLGSIAILLICMAAKLSISCAYLVVYVYCAELWPTCVRQTMFNGSSGIGRIGPMLATLTPLLVITLSMS